MAHRLTVQDRKWQAQSDLSTLTQADEIRASSSRLKAATTAASEQTRAIKTAVAKPSVRKVTQNKK